MVQINIIIIVTSPMTESDQFPSHIWAKSRGGIHSGIACHGQIDRVEVKPQPMSSNLKASLGHGYVAIDSIKGILHLGR